MLMQINLKRILINIKFYMKCWNKQKLYAKDFSIP